LAWNPDRISAGASGAIFGIYGALLGYLVRQHNTVPGTVIRALGKSTGAFLLYNLLYGFTHPRIDQSAHIGGLLSGLLFGLASARPLDIAGRRGLTLRNASLLVLGLAGTLGGAFHAVPSQGEMWLRRAKRGDADAQFLIGLYYVSQAKQLDKTKSKTVYSTALGVSVGQNEIEAVTWFRKAALQGHPKAQYFLGEAYANGSGVPKDKTEAARWYRKAAEKGDVPAQCALGSCYERGRGLEKDVSKAAEWYRKAAQQGSVFGENGLAWILATSEDPKIRNGAQAVQFAELAASATQHKNPNVLDTLAAAYAATGQFERAIDVERQALVNTNAALKLKFLERLQLYESRSAYREY
jgi:hypothetical protein